MKLFVLALGLLFASPLSAQSGAEALRVFSDTSYIAQARYSVVRGHKKAALNRLTAAARFQATAAQAAVAVKAREDSVEVLLREQDALLEQVRAEAERLAQAQSTADARLAAETTRAEQAETEVRRQALVLTAVERKIRTNNSALSRLITEILSTR